MKRTSPLAAQQQLDLLNSAPAARHNRSHVQRSSWNIVVSLVSVATEDELKTEIERLRAENEVLKRPTRGQASLKVSEKGALSVYGMGRFPVTLYREQWEKLLNMADEIRTFIQQNDHLLKKKE
jgi:hypothetical protein